jgi:biotin operon repressor
VRSQQDYFRHVAGLRQRGDIAPREHTILSVVAGCSMGDSPVTLEDLKESLDCSERQIYRDLKRLESMGLMFRKKHRKETRYYPKITMLSQQPQAAPNATQQRTSKPPKASTKPKQRTERVAVKVPGQWVSALSPKQQAHIRTYTVQQHKKEGVERALLRYTPDEIDPAILERIRGAIDPIAYLSSLATPEGSLPPHCLLQQKPPEKANAVKHSKPPTGSTPPIEEPRRKLTPEEQAKCDKEISEMFAIAQQRLAAMPDPQANRRRTSRLRETF